MKKASHNRSYVVWLCLYVMPRMGKYTEIESRSVAGKGWKKRKRAVTANAFGVSFGGWGKCSKTDYGEGCTALNRLKHTQLYSWNNGWIAWNGNYILIKLVCFLKASEAAIWKLSVNQAPVLWPEAKGKKTDQEKKTVKTQNICKNSNKNSNVAINVSKLLLRANT